MRADDHTPIPDPPGSEARPPSLEPIYCTLGETLCRIHVWTPEQWEQLDPARRPEPAEFVPGLGWVAPVPCAGPV